jgi:MGT family glycosyltransferase
VAHGLTPYRFGDTREFGLAQIAQQPAFFDFPRSQLPTHFHYTGPWHSTDRDSEVIPFPWEKLDGRPLVYASLGTLQNSREALFRTFAEACRGLDVQLVISHGGGLTPDEASRLPGAPLVVSYAPQADVLGRAALTITHAGLNTVLDSMANGVPVVAVPITYEQPAIARRVEWAGAGRAVPLSGLTPDRLRDAVTSVLKDPACRAAAQRLSAATKQAGGTRAAADIVESVCR